jgi:hypothetical protein
VEEQRLVNPVIERADVDAILSALLDICGHLAAIRLVFEEDDDGEEEEEEAPS